MTRPRGRSHRNGAPAVGLRRLGGGQFELVHPACVRERADDVEEVHRMLAAGERDIARNELRWLLEGCSDFLEVHVLLGRLAWEEGDVALARGHNGYAYEVGRRALGRRFQGQLPYRLAANRPLLEAGAGLAHCLESLGRRQDAVAVAHEVLGWDPSDPLELADWLEGL